MKKRNKIELENEENNEEVVGKNNEVEKVDESKKGIKKTIFYIFYLVFGVACLILLILTLFDKPKEFILDRANIILGIGIMVYSVLFLLPYTFKKKESKWINLLSQIYKLLDLLFYLCLGV